MKLGLNAQLRIGGRYHFLAPPTPSRLEASTKMPFHTQLAYFGLQLMDMRFFIGVALLKLA